MGAEQNRTWIVVEDPSGEQWEGGLVDVGQRAPLEARGTVLLPIMADLLRQSGVGGFHKRAWGSGWPLDMTAPRIVGPLTMYCTTTAPMLYWAAKLVPTAEFLERLESQTPDSPVRGSLRIAADPGQCNPHKAGVMAVGPAADPTHDGGFEVRELHMRSLTPEGAFILRGAARLRVPSDAHYGFGLYGMAPGLRLVWAAVTQAVE